MFPKGLDAVIIPHARKRIFCLKLGNSLCTNFLVGVLLGGCTTQEPVQVNQIQPPSATVEPTSELPEPTSAPTASATTAEDRLWEKLAQADEETYVVLLRHALAPGTGDPSSFRLDDCFTQRNLSEAGREQAIAIGKAFQSRNILVEKVLSSQWCRCLETAELLEIGPVEPLPALNSFFADRSTANTQTAQIQDYVANNQDRPGVIVMVTHQVNITALSGIFPQSGSAVVAQLEEGQLKILGQILEPDS